MAKKKTNKTITIQARGNASECFPPFEKYKNKYEIHNELIHIICKVDPFIPKETEELLTQLAS